MPYISASLGKSYRAGGLNKNKCSSILKKEREVCAVNQETFVQAVCNRINDCQHPRRVFAALALLAKMRVQDADHMIDQGQVLLRELPALLQKTEPGQ